MTSHTLPSVKIRNLSKTYSNGIEALININLEMSSGIYGLLGKNGAGKSTLMRTLATLQPVDSGEAQLDNIDLLNEQCRAREFIGYLPQEMGVPPYMSAYEALEYYAGLKGFCHSINIYDELDKVNLGDVAHQRLDTFSGGMRQRFGIAVAFLGSPRLVIVDEPTAGLDPFERRRFQHLLLTTAQDCVLILSSHIVEDIQDLASRMAILDNGQVIAEGSPDQLVSTLQGKVWSSSVTLRELEDWKTNAHVLSCRPRSGSHLLRVWSENSPGEAFSPASPDLEDFYAYRIGQDQS